MERALSTMQCLKSRDQQHPTWGGVGVELGGEHRPQRQWRHNLPDPCGESNVMYNASAKLHDADNNDDTFDQALLQNSSGRVPEHIWWPKAVYITLVASRHSYCGLKSCKGVQ